MKIESTAASFAFLAATGAVAVAAWLGSSLITEREQHANTQAQLSQVQHQLAAQDEAFTKLEADLAAERERFHAMDGELGRLRVDLSEAQLAEKQAHARIANAEQAREKAEAETERLQANLERFDREVRTLSELATQYRAEEIQLLNAELEHLRLQNGTVPSPFTATEVLAHADGLVALRPTNSNSFSGAQEFALADANGLLGTLILTRSEPNFVIAQWKAPAQRAKGLQTGATVYIFPL